MKTLLILGASSDIGRALIEKVADSYDIIWAHYRTPGKLDELTDKYGDKVRPVFADLSSVDEVTSMVDILIGAGGEPDDIVHIPMAPYEIKKFAKTDYDSFESSMNLALRSSVIPLQAFLPVMKKRGRGRVVFVLSSVTEGDTPANQSVYVTVKYALLGLMKSLAAEYAGSGGCINAVSPDMIDTAYVSGLSHLILEQYAASRPSGRLLAVDEVVPHIAGLLSDESGDLNGANILVE